MRYLVLVWLAGCLAMTPQAPPDFVPGRVSGGLIDSVPYVPTRVVVRTQDKGDVELRSRFEGTDHASLYLLTPRLRFTHRLDDRWQWGGTVGLSTLGVDLRERPWNAPVVLSFGAQVATLPALADGRSVPWDARALLSAQPKLGSIELLLGVGGSVGTREHTLYLSDEVSQYGVDQQAPNTLGFDRHELWGEALLGVAFELAHTRFTLAVQPFYVVAHGNATLEWCGGCVGGGTLMSAEANWGASFTLSVLAR